MVENKAVQLLSQAAVAQQEIHTMVLVTVVDQEQEDWLLYTIHPIYQG